MAFWKKSEAPWDMDPAKKRAKQEREPIENPLNTLRDWSEERRAKAAAKQAEWEAQPKEVCPWCGKEMERGYLAASRSGIIWTPGRMTTRAAWIGPSREVRDRRLQVDNEGFLANYKTTWYCEDCKKMTIDASGLLSPENTDRWSALEEPEKTESAGEGEEAP